MTNNGSSTNSDGRAKLVFHKYGNAYFLAAAWLPNSDHAREFCASANEIQSPATADRTLSSWHCWRSSKRTSSCRPVVAHQHDSAAVKRGAHRAPRFLVPRRQKSACP